MQLISIFLPVYAALLFTADAAVVYTRQNGCYVSCIAKYAPGESPVYVSLFNNISMDIY